MKRSRPVHNEPKVWSFRGDYFKAKGNLDAALESFTKAIELGRNNIVDRGNRALVLIDMRKYAEAAKETRNAWREDPHFFAGHLVEGLLALTDKDYAKAQTGLQEAMKQNPHYTRDLLFIRLCPLDAKPSRTSRPIAQRIFEGLAKLGGRLCVNGNNQAQTGRLCGG